MTQIANSGIKLTRPGLFGRLIGRKPSLPLHIPIAIRIFNGKLELTLDSQYLHKGAKLCHCPPNSPLWMAP